MNFNYLLRESQFHGGRRLAEKYFRWWWSLGMLLLFGAAVAVISVTVQRFLSNPTYMVQEETVQNTREFPSVVVCPEVLFFNWKIDKFLKNIKIPQNLNISYVKNKIYQLAAFFSPDVLYNTYDLENLEMLLEYNAMDLNTAGLLLTTTCEETLIRCRWHGNLVNCSELFVMELTGDGYCCVFNGRSLRRRFEIFAKEKKYKTRYVGFQSGLMLVVNQTQKPYNVDLSYKWLALRSSGHFIESSINGTPLNPGSEQWAAYHIRNFQIAEGASDLSENLKKCRMKSEPMKYYPIYHRRYCQVECEMHRTLDRCNCVRNIHPLPVGAKYCRARDLPCAEHAKVTYDSDECYCPSACDVATDFVTTITFPLIPGSHSSDSFYEGLNFERVTIVRAFLQSRRERSNSRWSYFTKTDLFSQLGGSFNLFFGCSILTLLELTVLGVRWLKESVPKNTIQTDKKENTSNINKKKYRRKNKKKRVKLSKPYRKLQTIRALVV